MVTLRLELQSTGGTTAGFQIPDETVQELAGGGRPKVKATVQGYEFRSSIARMGGSYWLGMSADRRREAGVSAGQTLDLVVELDTEERAAAVPGDLAAALRAAPAAQAFFDGLSFSKKQWHIAQVEGAKTAETRERRIAKSVELLSAGRAR
jgi:hypothetical protein